MNNRGQTSQMMGNGCTKNFDNYEQNEDTIAYCGPACNSRRGWTQNAPGFHDWGNSNDRSTFEHAACKFPGAPTAGGYGRRLEAALNATGN